MVWASATASQREALLFAALAGAAERRLGGFNVQDLANTAWRLRRRASARLCCLRHWRGRRGGAWATSTRSILPALSVTMISFASAGEVVALLFAASGRTWSFE